MKPPHLREQGGAAYHQATIQILGGLYYTLPCYHPRRFQALYGPLWTLHEAI